MCIIKVNNSYSYIDSTEPLSTSDSEMENNITEKKHNFIQKIIVIPEVCAHCHKKFVKHIFCFYN